MFNVFVLSLPDLPGAHHIPASRRVVASLLYSSACARTQLSNLPIILFTAFRLKRLFLSNGGFSVTVLARVCERECVCVRACVDRIGVLSGAWV